MRSVCLTWCLIIFSNHIAFGNEEPAQVLLEKYNELVEVSGGMNVGAMFPYLEPTAGRAKSEGLPRIYLSIPGDQVTPDKEVCLELSSQDGKYYGLFAKKLTEGIGKQGILFESVHEELIKGYFPEEMVVLASIKDSCSKQSKGVSFIIASWSDNYTENKFSVYLNSLVHKNSVEVRFRDKKANFKIPCVRLGEKRNAGYNVRCDIDLSAKKIKIEDFLNLRIVRTEPGQNYRPVSVHLSLKKNL